MRTWRKFRSLQEALWRRTVHIEGPSCGTSRCCVSAACCCEIAAGARNIMRDWRHLELPRPHGEERCSIAGAACVHLAAIAGAACVNLAAMQRVSNTHVEFTRHVLQ